ncbi:FUSC family protein [Asanoa sp. NPDC050611]|uniref:FUSC family protein n=1 Tax=Asanoa sp. NPDC050611 TaxID=3157098 RepID=UPI0033FCF6A1
MTQVVSATTRFAKRLWVDGAVRRAARAAVVAPSVFAIGLEVVGNVSVGTFAIIGAFCQLLLVEFGGPMRERIQAELGLIAAGGVLIAIGTLVSPHVWLAAPIILLVAFLIVFSGVVSSVLASASVSLLLAVILAVSLPAGADQVIPRLAGWGLAAGAALLAVRFLWPAPTRDPLRAPTVAACRALAETMHAGAAVWRGGGPSPAEHAALVDRADETVQALHRGFLAAPIRPTGLTTSARARVRLIDELGWIRDITRHHAARAAGTEPAAAAKEAAGDLLDAAADLLENPDATADALHAAQRRLDAALGRMGRAVTSNPVPGAGRATEFVSALEPSFRVQEMAYAVRLVARNVDLSVAAERRTWLQRALGQQPGGLAGPFATARERALAHLQWHSTWLHNSLRGAVGVAAAVVVVHYTGVQHSFWVIFGALAVLRSNALATGQNAVRAMAGTVVGFVIGAVILIGIGTDIDVLWALLPVAILMAGVAPALISFAAGQAAFTVTLLILFNIIQPAGWQLGLIRIEDIAIGVGISILVGLLLWPRGARKELRTALADAYDSSAHYLRAVVAYAALCCDGAARPPPPTAEAQRSAAAARRLDDTFRTYLSERGAKPKPLPEITSLVNGVAGLRIASDAVLDLWQRDDQSPGDRAAARSLLLRTSRTTERWYADLAASIGADRPAPAPQPPDLRADSRLVEALRGDLSGGDGSTAVRVIWTADHLDATRRLETTLTRVDDRS